MGEAIIRLVSGKLVDVFHIQPGDVTIEDIAHALSYLNRFGGHTPYPYSVAQHSVFAAYLAVRIYGDRPNIVFKVLMHDIQEGVGCVDIPSPIKVHCPDYQRVELTVESQLREQFQCVVVDAEEQDALHYCDKLACELEQAVIRGQEPTDRSLRFLGIAAVFLRRMRPEEAKAGFLEWYRGWRP